MRDCVGLIDYVNEIKVIVNTFENHQWLKVEE
jgi:hypothetical protein